MPKAVILAAGRGTRMGDLTAATPKPMLTIRGRPILEILLDRLVEAGYTEALIVVGFHAGLIEAHFRDYGMPLRFAHQLSLDGTAPAALLARDFIGGDDFLLTFGDILAPADCYREILERLRLEPAAQAILGVKEVDDPFQGAAVYTDEEGRVTKIIEKPPRGQSTTRWNSAGIYAFRPSVFTELERVPRSPRGEFELTSAVEQLIDCGGILRMYTITGAWRDVGRPEDLEQLRQMP